MPQCSFCDEPAVYQCAWRMRRGGVGVPFAAKYELAWPETLCMKLACYIHAIEPDEGRAICCLHWHALAGKALPAACSEYHVVLADTDPDTFNPRPRGTVRAARRPDAAGKSRSSFSIRGASR